MQVTRSVYQVITIDYRLLLISCEHYWENCSFVRIIVKLRGPLKASNTKLDSLPSLSLAYSLGERVVERLQVDGVITRVW